MRKLFFVIAIALIISACKKDDDECHTCMQDWYSISGTDTTITSDTVVLCEDDTSDVKKMEWFLLGNDTIDFHNGVVWIYTKGCD